jgi:hypothetical protein
VCPERRPFAAYRPFATYARLQTAASRASLPFGLAGLSQVHLSHPPRPSIAANHLSTTPHPRPTTSDPRRPSITAIHPPNHHGQPPPIGGQPPPNHRGGQPPLPTAAAVSHPSQPPLRPATPPNHLPTSAANHLPSAAAIHHGHPPHCLPCQAGASLLHPQLLNCHLNHRHAFPRPSTRLPQPSTRHPQAIHRTGRGGRPARAILALTLLRPSGTHRSPPYGLRSANTPSGVALRAVHLPAVASVTPCSSPRVAIVSTCIMWRLGLPSTPTSSSYSAVVHPQVGVDLSTGCPHVDHQTGVNHALSVLSALGLAGGRFP